MGKRHAQLAVELDDSLSAAHRKQRTTQRLRFLWHGKQPADNHSLRILAHPNPLYRVVRGPGAIFQPDKRHFRYDGCEPKRLQVELGLDRRAKSRNPSISLRIRLMAFYQRIRTEHCLRDKQDEGKRLWVLKKSLNRTPFHLRACRRRFSGLRSTKWWPAEPVLLAD